VQILARRRRCFVGISIFEVFVFEFGDAFGAVVDCVSELPLESGSL